MNVRIFIFLIFAVFALSCGGGKKSSDSFFAKDETNEAADIVDAANKKLKQIKKRFKENEPRYVELKKALKEKNESKVRELSNVFVEEITAGANEGLEAIEMLKKAKEMNINADFKQYLDLKIISLEKYVEAFDHRRKAAEILGEGYDPKDVMKRDRVIAAFRQEEEKFNEIIEEGRQTSQDANELARESLNRKQK